MKATVGGRLGRSFAAITALIAVAAGTGWWGMHSLNGARAAIDKLDTVRDAIQGMRYSAADVTGWQGLVMADAGAYGNFKAVADDSYNRKGEMKSKAAIYDQLATAPVAHMNDAERALWDQLKPAWDDFFTWDATIAGWLRADPSEAARAKAMDSINGGAAAHAYTKVLDIADKLDELVSPRIQSLVDDAEQTKYVSQLVLVAALLTALVLAVVLSIRSTRRVVRPLSVMVRALGGLAEGDLTVRANIRGKDELARLGHALDQTTEAWRLTVANLASSADSMSSASVQLSDTAAQIAVTAEQTSAQAELVAEGAARVSSNVQTVAAGSDEMGASIREISENAGEAAGVASEAVTVAEATNAIVARLGTSSQEIGDVVRTITAIAEQTNLLALNATIEAARAGESGKGFAVVASEVKDLAQETARATDDIAQRVQAIQADTTDAVAAIDSIANIVGRISDFQNVIAAAVEEQTATTSEMSRNVAGAAEGSTDIAANIAGVAEAALSTATGATQSQTAAADIARMSEDLRATVLNFKI
jgi:methyl-accepting chemotaxis protein